MSDDPDAADAVDVDADADPADADHDDAEEPPAIDDDDRASLPSDLAAAADAADAAADEGGDGRDEGGDADDLESDTDTPDVDGDSGSTTAAATAGDTYGELYAQTLVSVTNAAIDTHGKPDAEKTDYAAAEQLGIPDHANRLVEEMGIGEDMPPGQALMASSAVFMLMNVAAKTDLPAEMMDDLEL